MTRFLVVVAGLACPVLAQNVLQKDLARQPAPASPLQRTLQINPAGSGTQQVQVGRDFAAEVRFRNAIVTGNAPGGTSFRGSVGYTDPLSFRSQLGSEDLFAFRRDSLYSGLGGAGLRGTDALQYQFALSSGSVNQGGLTGSLEVIRGAPTPAATAARPDRFANGLTENGVGANIDSRLGALRSPSAYVAERNLQPAWIGYRPINNELEELTASPLMGVRVYPKTPEQREAERRGLVPELVRANQSPTAYDELRERLRASFAFESRPSTTPPTANTTGTNTPGSNTPGTTTPGTSTPGATTPGIQPGTSPRLQPSTQPNAPAGAEPFEIGIEAVRKSLQVDRATALNQRRTEKAEDAPWDSQILKRIREAGATTSTLVSPTAGDDQYAVQMLAGQEAMAQGRYFNAEERYARALLMKPADASAMVGRLHAQLGAGLFASGSLNLRQLIVSHPEVSSMRYEGQLLPLFDRQAEVIAELRENIRKGVMRRESALVLAYMGFQRADKPMTVEGLDEFSLLARPDTVGESDPGPEEARSTAKLVEFLRAIWLGQDPPAAK